MTSIATVKPKLDTATSAAGKTVPFSFAVTNTAGRTLSVGAKVLADAPAQESWFALTGKAERELGKDDFDQFDVEVNLPTDAAAGIYKFRLLVYSTAAPGEDYTEGPTVSVEVPKGDTTRPPPPPPPFPWWIVAVAAVSVLLIGGGIAALLFLGAAKSVPKVTGLTLDDAIVKLEDAGLNVSDTGVTEEATGQADAGTVIKQSPEAGADQPEDKLVSLTIEQLTVPVPSVIGMKVPAARTLLNEARLDLAGKITYQRSSQFPGGAIIAQTPDANQRAIPGQEVAVTVAEELIRVPNLQNKSYTAARVALETLGLSVGKVSHEKTGGSPDTVVRQEPAPDAEAKAASKVDLWLVEKKIRVPNVKGQDVKHAQAALSKAGLKPVLFPIAPPAKSTEPTEKVKEQKPRANTPVYTGTDVTLVYYKRPLRLPLGIRRYKIEAHVMSQILKKTRELKQVDGDLRSVPRAPE